jgi:hypothetical protein
MRSFSGLAATLLLSCLTSAAEPAKVSVYPTQPVLSGTLVAPAASPTVLAGTLVPVRGDEPKPMPTEKSADKPMAPTAKDAAPALVPPTVSAVTISSCGACEATPCGTTLFRGRLFAASCGSDVCASPGRPALFGGLFGASSCSTCEPTGPCCPRAHAFLARLKSWLMFRPCDGPRVGLFRFEPYMPRSMTVFSCKGCDAGTCHAAGSCVGSSWRGGFGRGACATGQCGAGLGGVGLGGAGLGGATVGRDGMGLGLGARILASHQRVPQDCNGAEPKLSGARFDECYHFANAIPKSYGCRTTRINPIAGCVTPPYDEAAATTPAAGPTMIERAAATLPPPHPMTASRPASGMVMPASGTKETKATNPLKTPFSNP